MPLDGTPVGVTVTFPLSVPLGAVVIVTSATNPAAQHETLAMGADAYFVKPSHLHEFLWLGEVIKHLVFGDPPSFTQHI